MAWEVNAVHAGSYIQERNWGNVERNNTLIILFLQFVVTMFEMVLKWPPLQELFPFSPN